MPDFDQFLIALNRKPPDTRHYTYGVRIDIFYGLGVTMDRMAAFREQHGIDNRSFRPGRRHRDYLRTETFLFPDAAIAQAFTRQFNGEYLGLDHDPEPPSIPPPVRGLMPLPLPEPLDGNLWRLRANARSITRTSWRASMRTIVSRFGEIDRAIAEDQGIAAASDDAFAACWDLGDAVRSYSQEFVPVCRGKALVALDAFEQELRYARLVITSR